MMMMKMILEEDMEVKEYNVLNNDHFKCKIIVIFFYEIQNKLLKTSKCKLRSSKIRRSIIIILIYAPYFDPCPRF